jgi:hypothetical protein
MAKTLQFRRDTTANLASVTGAVGELFVDTTKNTVVVMDGSTAGGFPLQLEGEASYEVGQVIYTNDVPTQPGQWVKAGKYYSKAAYPELATKLGDFQDLGTPNNIPQSQLPQAFSATFNVSDIAATNGSVYVIVGNSGAIRVSSDTVNWIAVPSRTNQNLTEVKYLNGIFIAVGAAGVICTSIDGYTWSNAAGVGTTFTLTSIAYGAGQYVITANNGRVFTSPNSITWTERFAVPIDIRFTLPGTIPLFSLTKVIYENSLFVAVGNSCIILTSVDGITWSLRNFKTVNASGVTATFNNVKYLNEKYIAVGNGISAVSTDGVVWSSQNGTITGPLTVNNNSSFTNSTSPYLTATNGNVTVAVSSVGTIVRTFNNDGVNWMGCYTPIFTINSQGVFTELKYLNGLFVATTGRGTILTSTDGNVFEFVNSSGITTSVAYYTSVAYGNGIYVAVGADNSTNPLQMVSTNGVDWVVSGISGAIFNRVTFGAGLFVAGSSTAATGIMTSTDGITWTSRQSTNGGIRDVQYLNSMFIAGSDTGRIYYSTDGISWSLASTIMNGAGSISSITYSNELYIITATFSLATSTDGVNWTNRLPSQVAGSNPSWSHGLWDGTQWVVVGNVSNLALAAYATSTDGISWTTTIDVSFQRFQNFVVVNNIGIAVGYNGIYAITRGVRRKLVAGSAWAFSPYTSPTAASNKCIAYNGSNQWVVAGITSQLMYSSDGLDWKAAVVPGVSANFTEVQYLNGIYVAVGNNNLSGAPPILTSPDGINWTQRTTTGTATLNAVAFGAGTWVTVGSSGAIFSSTNGTTWSLATGTGSTAFADVTFGGTNFVAVGSSGVLYYSSNGTTWTLVTGVGNQQYNRVFYTGSQFIAVGNSGVIYTSPTGVTWTQRSSPATGLNLFDIATSNGTTLVAVGTGVIIVSENSGVTWVEATSPSTNLSLRGVSWTGTYWVAMSSTTGTCISIDGYRWEGMFTGSQVLTGNNKYALYAGDKLIVASTNAIKLLPTGSSKFFEIAPEAIIGGLQGANSLTVAYGAGVYVAVNNASNNNVGSLYTSTDGVVWQARLNAYSTLTNSVVWTGSEFVVVGFYGAYWTSPNGITWTGYIDATASNFTALVNFSGKIIGLSQQACVVLRGASRAVLLATTQSTTPSYAVLSSWTRMSAGDGTAIITNMGQNIPGYFYATTPDNFSSVKLNGVIYDALNPTQALNTFYVNGVFFALGSSQIHTSIDGITWTGFQTAGSARSVAYGNGVYVITLGTGILVSSDLTSWTRRLPLTPANDVAFGGGLFALGGNSSPIFTSPDGITWTQRTSSITIIKIIYANEQFVAVGGTIITSSPDGLTWRSYSQPANTAFIDIEWNGTVFCAISSTQSFVAIGNGSTWKTFQLNGTFITVSSSGANTFLIQGSGSSTGQNFLTLDNGTTWTSVADAYANNAASGRFSCQYVNGYYIAVQPASVQ